MFIFERERENILMWVQVSKWGRSRERGEQRIWNRLCTDSREPDLGLELTNHENMTWAEVGHLTHWATQAPLISSFESGKNLTAFGMSINKYSFNHSTNICWIQTTNKYSDNAPERHLWHEASERGAGFFRVTVVLQMEFRLESQSSTACERCWDVKWKNQLEKVRRHCNWQQKDFNHWAGPAGADPLSL